MTTTEAEEFISMPTGFAKGVLGFDLHDWQSAVCEETADLHGRTKVAVSTPNGAGKSSKVITTIILRTLCAKPQAKVVLTSGDYRQIASQVWPSVERHRHKFKGPWIWREHDHFIETPRGGFATMFTTDDPARAEGFHCEFGPGIDSPCVLICDEAKSVHEGIFEAFSARCTFNVLIYISSTGLMLGSFYRAMCGKGGFKRYSIGLDQCPHIPRQRIDELLEEYADNLDHPLLRSTLYGEFMDFSGDRGRFITLKDINKSLTSPPVRWAGETVAFCDFAGEGPRMCLPSGAATTSVSPDAGRKPTRWRLSASSLSCSVSTNSNPRRSSGTMQVRVSRWSPPFMTQGGPSSASMATPRRCATRTTPTGTPKSGKPPDGPSNKGK